MPTPPIDPPPRLADLDLVLRAPGLELRPLAVSDADAFWPYVSDPELPRMMSWSAHRDRAETVAYLHEVERARAEDRSIVWAFVVDGQVSGAIGLHDITRQMRAWRIDRAELGYWLASALHGRGLCSAAARAVVDFGFATLALHKITVGCFEENVASRRVIEKTGFRFLSIRREHCFRDGRWWDHRDYELTRDEWRP
jgi:[ribosomal protein S5]-alanine N-acetyltransferase